MNHNDVVLAAGPELVFFSPRKTALPRRLRITLWQTHSWTKKIIKLREGSTAREGSQAMRQRDK